MTHKARPKFSVNLLIQATADHHYRNGNLPLAIELWKQAAQNAEDDSNDQLAKALRERIAELSK